LTGIMIGQPAPKVVLPRDGGEILDLGTLRKRVVVFFYPRDDTSGCTKEAIEFSEQSASFANFNTVIVGVSKDSVKSHDKFVAKHNLLVPLLSDQNGNICEAFGVWVEKSMYGKKYLGIERSTFLIDENGLIQHIWKKVKVPGHVAEVLHVISTFGSE